MTKGFTKVKGRCSLLKRYDGNEYGRVKLQEGKSIGPRLVGLEIVQDLSTYKSLSEKDYNRLIDSRSSQS